MIPFWQQLQNYILLMEEECRIFPNTFKEDTINGRNPAPIEVGSLSHYSQGFYTSPVQDAFHQQYVSSLKGKLKVELRGDDFFFEGFDKKRLVGHGRTQLRKVCI